MDFHNLNSTGMYSGGDAAAALNANASGNAGLFEPNSLQQQLGGGNAGVPSSAGSMNPPMGRGAASLLSGNGAGAGNSNDQQSLLQQYMLRQQQQQQQQQLLEGVGSNGGAVGLEGLIGSPSAADMMGNNPMMSMMNAQQQQQQQGLDGSFGGSNHGGSSGNLNMMNMGMAGASGGNPLMTANAGWGAIAPGPQSVAAVTNASSSAGDLSLSLASSGLVRGGANATFAGAGGNFAVTGIPQKQVSDLSLSLSDPAMALRHQQQQQQQQGAANAIFAAQQQQQQQAMASLGGGGKADNYAEQGILGPWSDRAAAMLGSMVCADGPGGKGKRSRKKQPKDKPKRPLSAYNIFFKEERARLLEKTKTQTEEQKKGMMTANGKIGFQSLAKIIGSKWQEMKPEDVEYYKEKASKDMERYKKEMEAFKAKNKLAEEGGGEEASQEQEKPEEKEKDEAASDEGSRSSKKQKVQ